MSEITDEIFNSAVTIVQNLPKEGDITISNNEKLQFYALFKQATIGTCNKSKPAIWNVVERYKWDAWSSLGSLDSNKAKEEYVVKLRKVMDKVFENQDVNGLMQDDQWKDIKSLVEPHFENIGRPLTSSKQPTNNKLTIESNDTPALSSDGEYTDAPDSPVIIESTNIMNGNLMNTPSDPFTNGFKTELVSYVQTTTQAVLHQIQILSNTLQKQNAVIQKFIEFMKEKPSSTISWPFILLLVIWPICVQLAIRHFFRQH